MESLDETVEKLERDIDNSSMEIQNFLTSMLRIRAVNPKGGGKGEKERADFLEAFMKGEGFHVTRVDVKDDESGGILRPNLSSKIEGKNSSRTLWMIAHMDTVPEGSLELWQSDPFEPVVKEGKIIARGAEDNGQSLAASLFALREVKRLGLELPLNVGVWFVADEEAGSNYGVKYLIEHDYFRKDDLIIVPDAGSPEGNNIEIAEKGLLWLKFTVEGKQVHASLPKKGLNAHRVGMKFALEVDEFLHRKYSASDSRFNDPLSTFEPTKKEVNVSNINTIPGIDIAYFDCRVLPQYPLDGVVADVKARAAEYEQQYGARIVTEVIQKEPAGFPTSENSEAGRILSKSIQLVCGVQPRFVGIGGQTVGNLFRREGIPVVVWSKIDEVAHEPNEYCRVENLVNDTKVFATLPLVASSVVSA